jgi:hypothetical protein
MQQSRLETITQALAFIGQGEHFGQAAIRRSESSSPPMARLRD